MPRDANGIYSLPLPAVAAGTTITTLWGNTTTQDIAAALTDSLSRTAQGGMSGPLRLISGTAGAPSLAFVDQVGLGLYRSASGVMNFTVDGTTYVRFNALNQLEVLRDEGGGAQWWPVATTAGLGGAFFDYLQGYAVGGLHIEYLGNLNAITFNSKWAITKASVTNAPAGLAGSLAVIETDMWVAGTTEAVQTITGMDASNTGQIFMRTKVANFWGAWVSIDSSVIATNSANIATNAADIAALQAKSPVKVSYLTASDAAWVPTAGAKVIQFILTAGGGGGGGTEGSGDSTAVTGNGGSAGATCILQTTVIDASYNITLPPPAAGGASGQNPGANASPATIVSTTLNMVAGGGVGGVGRVGGSAQNQPGQTGGLASGGDLNLQGGGSSPSIVISSRPANPSTSGGSYWGGGMQSLNHANGVAAVTPGVGGQSNWSINEGGNRAGGAGGPSICQITEYF